ncbi:MAG: tetratricopeptide repeat protein [Flavobacteriales bacterium]|nr:tetratricopeptide repeat protein [Flavobacteriales bacterium]
MRPIPLLLCFALAVLVNGQNAESPYLDSLWKVYRAAAHNDPDRLLTLHAIVNETQYDDPDSAHVLADELMRQASAQQDTIAMALAHRDYGTIANTRRDNHAAIEHYRRAIALYATSSDTVAMRGMAATMHNMGVIHMHLGEMDTALSLYRRSMALDERIRNNDGLMYCFGSLGRVHEIQGSNDSAIYYYAKSGGIAEQLGEKRMVAASLGNRANVYERMGQIGPAIDFAYKCLEIMERLNNERGIAVSLTTVASLKDQLGETEASLALLRRSHALYTKVGYRRGMMTSGRSIGGALLRLDQPDSAIAWLERSAELEREFEAKDILAPTLNSLARAYRETGRPEEAEKILQEALSIGRELKDAPTEAATLAILGRVALDSRKAQEAITHCTNGLRVATDAAALTERGDNCQCLYLAHKAIGDGMTAVRYLEEYQVVQDSLENEKNARELTARDLLYTFGKEQLADSLRYAGERLQLESERTIESMRADQNRNRALATGGGALLLLAGAAAWFISDRRRRQERHEKEAATLETQALRSQMNPHFIFNALNSINAFVQRNDQDSASSYLGKFARVMRSVLENSRHAEVSLSEDLEALRGYMDLERMRMDKKFDFTVEVDPALDPEEVMVPPLVVQPFVENAIWHGMAGKEGQGHIRLKVEAREKQLLWIIEDDGAGRHAKKTPLPEGTPTTAVKKTSLGTTITRARLDLVQKQHGGKAGFKYVDLPQGTRVEVDMPLMYMN